MSVSWYLSSNIVDLVQTATSPQSVLGLGFTDAKYPIFKKWHSLLEALTGLFFTIQLFLAILFARIVFWRTYSIQARWLQFRLATLIVLMFWYGLFIFLQTQPKADQRPSFGWPWIFLQQNVPDKYSVYQDELIFNIWVALGVAVSILIIMQLWDRLSHKEVTVAQIDTSEASHKKAPWPLPSADQLISGAPTAKERIRGWLGFGMILIGFETLGFLVGYSRELCRELQGLDFETSINATFLNVFAQLQQFHLPLILLIIVAFGLVVMKNRRRVAYGITMGWLLLLGAAPIILYYLIIPAMGLFVTMSR